MGHILTVYSQSAYKEYLLPAVKDADYSLTLPKDLFQLREDVVLDMENLHGCWRFLRSDQYSLFYTSTKEDAAEKDIQNDDIYTLRFPSGEQIAVVVRITDSFFRVFTKYRLDGVARLTIGASAESSICFQFMNIISATHAILFRKGNQWWIEDRSRNGLFVNACRVSKTRELAYGDHINIFGLSLVYLDKILAFDTTREGVSLNETLQVFQNDGDTPCGNKGKGSEIFHSAPRYLPKLASDVVKIDNPPNPREEDRRPLALTIGPSLTMAIPMLLGSGLAIFSSRAGSGSSAFMYTGLITAVSSALIGTIWALVNLHQAKKKLREDELRRFEAYGEYLISCTDKVKAKYARNTELLRQLYPDAASCCRYDSTSSQLWNRNFTHQDFLHQRLGLGELPFQVTIDVPQERFTIMTDSLSEKARMIQENYAMLKDVPVCVDLGRKVLGVIGGEGKRGCYPVVQALAAQLAANNCYTNVKMAFLYDGQRGGAAENWGFARWLPHVWSEDKRSRYVADHISDASDVLYEIAKVLRMRAEGEDSRETVFKPHYIIFIEDPTVLEGEPIAAFLLDARQLGVSVVLLADRYEDLPNVCEYIVENTPHFQGLYEVTDPVEDRQKIRFDTLHPGELERFARRLSGIQVKEIETGGELPARLTFFEMYGVHRLSELGVMDRWQKNRTYENIRGLLGQKAGGSDCYLDVHEKYHGPHGLVAGTTGSGKSETLQTYMLSLAVNYSPDDIGFFVIDYKGGGMANLFSGLPHLIGQISNLSGNQVHRAMVSIKSENMRRQRVFNEHGVNNINSYTRLYKNGEATLPVPHMFIIIDEFAELKREEPDFMKELISVAQVGRSLGVHLILATQKPSGTVDDNIWSNAKFRLCLRVQDRQDSKDMLHRPDAAYITQAGRCFLQVGNDEIFELFQSGWSGAEYDEDEDGADQNIATLLSATGKAALVGGHLKLKKREQQKLQWAETLLQILVCAGATSELLHACMNDSVKLDALTERFFQCAAKRGVDYPWSDYNASRVRDLIHTCATVPLDEAERARVLLLAAERLGKKLPEVKKKTQLEAVVEYLAQTAEQNNYVHNLQLWLPVLPESLCLHQLSGYSQNAFDGTAWPEEGARWELEAIVGLCDDPVNQAQMPLTVDLAKEGHHAICGAVMSGKSTFLLTLLYSLVTRYTPGHLNIYALDFSSKMLSAFEGLAHVGGVLYENDTEKISKLVTMLGAILEERKLLLKGGNFQQYAQARQKDENAALPAILIAIDNYSAFRAKTNNIYDDFMMKLSKEGGSCGIFLVVTALGFSATEIPSRLGENLRTVICLEMNDKFAYADALRTLRIEVLPEENIKGRGLAKIGEAFLEFQTALPLEAKDDFARSERVKEECHKLNEAWTGRFARHIPEIPAKPVWKDFALLDDVCAMQRQADRIPVGYDQKNAAVYGIDLRRIYCYLISGKARTGKTNMLRTILASLEAMDGDIVLIDYAKEFSTAGEQGRVRSIASDKDLYQYLTELQTDFIARNQFKKACMDAGDTDEELYDRMQKFRKLFILIGSLPDFVKHTAKPDGGVPPMAPFLCNLLEKGMRHNVYWFACLNPDDNSQVTGMPVYNNFIRYKAGVHFGGNAAAQRILDFEYLKINERSKALKPGIGLLPAEEDGGTERIVIPLCRR